MRAPTPQVVSSEERALLLKIARCPLIAEALGGGRPCSEVVAAQRVAEGERQVPEGWAGNLLGARVVFVSSNPSISEPGPGQHVDEVEPFPTASAGDEEIAEFIGRRFDQTVHPSPWVAGDRSLLRSGRYCPRPTRFWVSIRARARELLGDAANPARNYVMTEVVHCKSRREIGVASAAATCASRYLDDILKLSAAPLVVVVGKTAHASLKAWLPALPEPPYVVSAELGGRARALAYIAHPSSWGEPKTILNLYGTQMLGHLQSIAQGRSTGPGPDVRHETIKEPGQAAGGGARDDGHPRPSASRPAHRAGRQPSGGEPIQPVRGPLVRVPEIAERAIVATRETVRGRPDPALRLFTGDVHGRNVGDTFDSYHKVNKMPCGVWTVIAVVEGGRLAAGHLPEGLRKLRVNNLG